METALPELIVRKSTPARVRPGRADLLRASLWLGLIGFGGGLSVLANIHELIVKRRGWLTEREFSNTVTVSQMLPGGAAANALAYVGLRFGGALGALGAYGAFILPGWIAVMGLAVAYVHFGTTPHVETVLGGFNAAVVGVIVSITLKMMRTSVSRLWQMGVAGGALLLSIAGNAPPGEIAVLSAVAGLAVDLGTKRMRLRHVRRVSERAQEKVALPDEGSQFTPLKDEEPRPRRDSKPPPADRGRGSVLAPPALALGAVLLAAMHMSGIDKDLLQLGLTFLRTGLGAYGGGFAIVPHLKTVMDLTGWLTPRQFADAVAIGKLTPGPVLLLATFIGYVRHGFAGAVISTVAIFAAPFALIVLAGGFIDRVRSRRPVRAALRGLTPAVLGLMAAAAISLGGSLSGEAEVAIAAVVALTLVRFEANPALMLALGGLARLALRFAGV